MSLVPIRDLIERNIQKFKDMNQISPDYIVLGYTGYHMLLHDVRNENKENHVDGKVLTVEALFDIPLIIVDDLWINATAYKSYFMLGMKPDNITISSKPEPVYF